MSGWNNLDLPYEIKLILQREFDNINEYKSNEVTKKIMSNINEYINRKFLYGEWKK